MKRLGVHACVLTVQEWREIVEESGNESGTRNRISALRTRPKQHNPIFIGHFYDFGTRHLW
jgi:hypothetical protein